MHHGLGMRTPQARAPPKASLRILHGQHLVLMRVTQVAIRPTEASEEAGRPALTPELLAATGARYSRNNEGLENILSKIDPNNLDKSVDSIFRMIDYGHQSIADMVPVAVFIDGISIWLAYLVWTLCPTASGQESSTRYIKISKEGLIPAEDLGIPSDLRPQWDEMMSSSFEGYQSVLRIWEMLAEERPSLLGIPQTLLSDPSDGAQKKVARLKRNYAFDRSRYFLPVAAATNIMLIMSARGWVQLCQYLLSHPLPEPQALGRDLLNELRLSTPRMLKHARKVESTARGIETEFLRLARTSSKMSNPLRNNSEFYEAAVAPHLFIDAPEDLELHFHEDLTLHENRYAWVGESLRRTIVRFGWSAVSFAEIRDLNRHRTGVKYCPLIPQGFYFASEQVPLDALTQKTRLDELKLIGRNCCLMALNSLERAVPSYVYWMPLGVQLAFEHTTTADKFIYEAELRTGVGAHFRYAQHLRDMLRIWYSRFPRTKGLIAEGSAEPE
jgi:thymidylate synthase ThyX